MLLGVPGHKTYLRSTMTTRNTSSKYKAKKWTIHPPKLVELDGKTKKADEEDSQRIKN